MNDQESQQTNHPKSLHAQQVKRGGAISAVIFITGFLLLALYTFLAPNSFVVPVVAQSSNLIVNGNFGGLSPWQTSGTVQHGYLDVAHGNVVTLSVNTTKIYQTVTPAETGVYQLSFDYSRWGCCSGANLQASVGTSNPDVMVYSQNYGNNNGAWSQSGNKLLLLEAGTTYTVTLKLLSNTKYRIDNVSLTKLYDEEYIDIDTGLIENGDFIGPSGWNYENGFHILNVGAGNLNTTVGAGLAGGAASTPTYI